MWSGNKNVDKLQQNTDKQGNKNPKNNKAIEEDPTVSRVCGQSQQNTEKQGNRNWNNNESIEEDPTAKNKLNTSNSNNSGNKDKTSEKNHPIGVETVTNQQCKEGVFFKTVSEDSKSKPP